MKPSFPAATDSVENLADWLELEAVRSPRQEISLETLVRVIRRSGTTDAIVDAPSDVGSETSQAVAQDAFSEAETRTRACGVDGAYPFEITHGLLSLRKGWKSSPYVLLLLLSKTTPTGGYGGTAMLFERICSHAARQYFGGSANSAAAVRFGSPRRAPLTQLRHAIDDLCVKLAEGSGCGRPDKAKHTGDEGLDIVAWRHFPDGKAGKLVAFGQCAGGARDWSSKLTELDGRKFAQKWFRQQLVVEPLRFFFVPRRIPGDDWSDTGIDGGIVFDRCRIVACLRDMDRELTQACKIATRTLMAKVTAK